MEKMALLDHKDHKVQQDQMVQLDLKVRKVHRDHKVQLGQMVQLDLKVRKVLKVHRVLLAQEHIQ
jgi:hypothetical protein